MGREIYYITIGLSLFLFLVYTNIIYTYNVHQEHCHLISDSNKCFLQLEGGKCKTLISNDLICNEKKKLYNCVVFYHKFLNHCRLYFENQRAEKDLSVVLF